MLVVAANKPSRSNCATLLSQMLTFVDLLNQAGDALEVLLYRWLNFRIELIQETPFTVFRESLRGVCFTAETTIKPKMLQASTYLHAVKCITCI